MTALTRKAIRQGIVTRLGASAISPLDVATIYDSRMTPVQPGETGIVMVSTPTERGEQLADGQPTFRQITTVVIESHVTADIDPLAPASGAVLAAALDDLNNAIHLTLFEDPTWLEQFSKFPRNESQMAADPTQGVCRGSVTTTIDLQWSVAYEPDAAYYDDLEGFDVETTPIREDTEIPSTVMEINQIIDLP